MPARPARKVCPGLRSNPIDAANRPRQKRRGDSSSTPGMSVNSHWPPTQTPSTSSCTRMRPCLQPASSPYYSCKHPHRRQLFLCDFLSPPKIALAQCQQESAKPSVPPIVARSVKTRRCFADCGESEGPPPKRTTTAYVCFICAGTTTWILASIYWKTSLSHPTVATTLPSRSPWRTGRMRAAGHWTTSSTSTRVTFRNSSNNSSGQEG